MPKAKFAAVKAFKTRNVIGLILIDAKPRPKDVPINNTAIQSKYTATSVTEQPNNSSESS